ncbi:MAG: DUF5667 domain-containing protein [Actinobacteria bacterium]|nr:DUF5667 domain-containing protein [Cyanobacteriota bacterium]MCL5772494.1 DUF5667 domain-containing protein [Actinomycetota bacterium]
MFKRNTTKYKEKVINKFINLIDKGYDVKYCFKKFPVFNYYKDDINLYLNTIDRIKGFKSIEPSDEYKNTSLEKIYQSAKQYDKNLLIKNSKSYKLSKFKKPFLKPVVIFISAFLFLTFSYTGTVFASQNSIPGDVLYNVKKSAENIQLSFTPYSKQGSLHFKFLNKRINEANTILNKNTNISDEEINNLFNTIDYEFQKCNEHHYLNNQDNQKISNEINTIKMQYQKRYRKRYGPGNSNTSQTTTTSYNQSTIINNDEINNTNMDGSCMDFNDSTYNSTNKQTGNNDSKQNSSEQTSISSNNDKNNTGNDNLLNNSTETTNGLNYKGFNYNNGSSE